MEITQTNSDILLKHSFQVRHYKRVEVVVVPIKQDQSGTTCHDRRRGCDFNAKHRTEGITWLPRPIMNSMTKKSTDHSWEMGMRATAAGYTTNTRPGPAAVHYGNAV